MGCGFQAVSTWSRGAESTSREGGPAEQAGVLWATTELVWKGLLSPREMGEVGSQQSLLEQRELILPHFVCNQSLALERERSLTQGLHSCWCGLEGWVTSELPRKQSTAKLRTFPEAGEVACVRDHSQRSRSAEICSVNVLAGLLQSERQALLGDNSAV